MRDRPSPRSPFADLPPLTPKPKAGTSFFAKKAWKATSAKTPKLSLTAVKKAAKLLENMGKTITGIELQPNGSLSITASDKASKEGHAALANAWDEEFDQ